MNTREAPLLILARGGMPLKETNNDSAHQKAGEREREKAHFRALLLQARSREYLFTVWERKEGDKVVIVKKEIPYTVNM